MFASIFVYNDVDKSLYSMLSVYVGMKVLDVLLTGRPSKKIVNIVSTNIEILKEQIREKIEEHGTILTGIGLHQGQNKNDVSFIEKSRFKKEDNIWLYVDGQFLEN